MKRVVINSSGTIKSTDPYDRLWLMAQTFSKKVSRNPDLALRNFDDLDAYNEARHAAYMDELNKIARLVEYLVNNMSDEELSELFEDLEWENFHSFSDALKDFINHM